ncbi:MAG: lipid-A-disaccharide synthase N-terminal domain-containing protein [Candidatus Pacebacteria bacterium]|nr:lipid-A-disaccharide synthase N-terminal domain-containing protein [Candidatus Paceibacterota bacterium]
MESLTLYNELMNPWVIFGFFGQFVFFMRFVFQWLKSEKKHEVVIPMSFWWLSIIGSILILIYSIHIKDIVFSTAQVLSLAIYVRNMVLQSQFDHHSITPKLKDTP